MKILNNEQLAYLKSLESPKKRRKFMLDCLVENALGELAKFKEEINRLNISYQTCTAPETLKSIANEKCIICHTFEKQECSDKCVSCNSVLKHSLKINESAKHNHTPEEIEIAKSLNSEREEKKFTLEDMELAFVAGNMATMDCFITPYVTMDTESHETSKAKYLKAKKEYLNSLKND